MKSRVSSSVNIKRLGNSNIEKHKKINPITKK